MTDLSAVRRYARALFQTAQAQGQVDTVEEDLAAIHGILRSNPDLFKALRAPTLSAEQKKALLNAAFSGGERLTLRFLALTVDRRREALLPEMYPEYLRLANDYRKVLPVQVRTAAELSPSEQTSLADVLKQRTGKTVRMEIRLEPELIGGMIVRMGDTVIDGSLRARLEQVRSRLLAAPLLGMSGE